MKPITINAHSLVDLITNSSSEVFIIQSDKTIDTIKEVIVELGKLYNQRVPLMEDMWSGEVDIAGMFTSVFKEPTVSQYEFNIHDFSRVSEFFDMFPNKYRDSRDLWGDRGTDTHPTLALATEKIKEWHKNNPSPLYPKVINGNYETPEYEQYEKDHSDWCKKQEEAAGLIYVEWNNLVLDIYTDLYKWAAEVNGTDLTPLGKPMIDPGSWSRAYFENRAAWDSKEEKSPAEKFIDEIDEAISWGYIFEKGTIFLYSASDNTVPCNFYQDIEQAFKHVDRRHLG